MVKYSLYIITCDKTNWVLKLTIPLLEKYWNIEKSVKILGYNKPDVQLPIDYEFISMKKIQLSIDEWTEDIYNIMKNDPNEYVIFMLDDFLPVDYLNSEVLNYLFDEMEKDKNIVRAAIGSDMQFLKHKIVKEEEKFKLIELDSHSNYRVTTQPSIWRKNYLIEILKVPKTPWNFETTNNPRDNKRMIGTLGDYAYWVMCEGAISSRYLNKINVLGLKFEDVKYFIENGIFNDTSKLQYGMHFGFIPEFSRYGFDFNLELFKTNGDLKHYNEYKIRYNNIYNK